MLKFKENSKLDKFIFGVFSGLIVSLLITSIIIYANSKNFTVWEHYLHMFDRNDIGKIIRPSVLMSLKGGTIAVMPLFYLFLNKKMMKAVKGLITVVAFIGIFIVWGIFS